MHEVSVPVLVNVAGVRETQTRPGFDDKPI